MNDIDDAISDESEGFIPEYGSLSSDIYDVIYGEDARRMLALQTTTLIDMWESIDCTDTANEYIDVIGKVVKNIHKMNYTNRVSFCCFTDSLDLTYLCYPHELMDERDDSEMVNQLLHSWSDHNIRNLISSLMESDDPQVTAIAIDAMHMIARQKPNDIVKLINSSTSPIIRMPEMGDEYEQLVWTIYGYVTYMSHYHDVSMLTKLTRMVVQERNTTRYHSVVNIIMTATNTEDGFIQNQPVQLKMIKFIQAAINDLNNDRSTHAITGEETIHFDKDQRSTEYFGRNHKLLRRYIIKMKNMHQQKAFEGEWLEGLKTLAYFAEDYIIRRRRARNPNVIVHHVEDDEQSEAMQMEENNEQAADHEMDNGNDEETEGKELNVGDEEVEQNIENGDDEAMVQDEEKADENEAKQNDENEEEKDKNGD